MSRVIHAMFIAMVFCFLCTQSASNRLSAEPLLKLDQGDRVVIIGNTLAERMQHYGHFETLLHSRFPSHQLVVRNLGWSADELTLRPRSKDFKDHGHRLEDHKPDVVIAAFGFNESFGGAAGVTKFEKDLDAFVKETRSTKYNGKEAPTLVLLSPIAHEDLGRSELPDGKRNNGNIALYANSMAKIAKQNGVAYVDLFHPSKRLMDESSELTINGVHLNDMGYRQLAPVLDSTLFGPRTVESSRVDFAALRAEILERNLQFWYDYRAVNGFYIYGGRKKTVRGQKLPEGIRKATQDDQRA